MSGEGITLNMNIEDITEFLKRIISEKLDVDVTEIDMDEAFFTLGVNSFIVHEILNELNCYFKDLTSTILFQYPNITKLSNYLLSHKKDNIKLDGFQNIQNDHIESKPEKKIDTQNNAITVTQKKNSSKKKDNDELMKGYGIAVIGLSGKFPKADDQFLFWNNLYYKKDCIEEIPTHRWDYTPFFSDDKKSDNTLYCKWGGFINDIDKFDPLFFHISPKEAELLDPQQKLFLNCCWEVMEDAGYGRIDNRKNNIGVYAGVTWNEFSLLAHEKGYLNDQYGGQGSLYWGIANRVSYFLDFTGPSITIDTACSSSLVAIHQACHAILSGECDMAIAGGINLNLHPSKYIYLSQSKFLSTDGRCRSFGTDGDGYVPGEGVGAVLLKPYKEAIADGDNIYGIIRGSATNHGGRSTGYTVPNPESHQELIATALERAHAHPEDISYIECHGTGTALGDPIEIKGLSLAFEKYTEKKQFCGIGSVKSNIGHLEAAAGIAGLIKILLSMRYNIIPASLHAAVKNPEIDFNNSPFYLIQENQEWQSKDKKNRLAGISSFGAGGTNAHLIVESYEIELGDQKKRKNKSEEIIVLSAQSESQIIEYAEKINSFLTFIQDHSPATKQFTLNNIACTLRNGRECYSYRVAILASDLLDLQNKINIFIKEQKSTTDIYYGYISTSEKNKKGIKKSNEAYDSVININDRELIASSWISGELDNIITERKEIYKKISLPTYPFQKKRSWISNEHVLYEAPVNKNKSYTYSLIDSNESTTEELLFKKVLTGKEFYIKDHIVGGKNILPGVAYIEMACMAGNMADKNQIVQRIKNIIWEYPVEVGEKERAVYINLHPKDRGFGFIVSSILENGEKISHAKGLIEYGVRDVHECEEKISVEQIKKRLSFSKDRESVYNWFKCIGLNYGITFQPIREVYYNDHESLSKIVLPDEIIEGNNFILHPTLMDGALQTSAIINNDENSNALFLPFSIQEVEIVNQLKNVCIVHAEALESKNNDIRKFNITIYDDNGNTLIKMKNFIGRIVNLQVFGNKKESEPLMMHQTRIYYKSVWKRVDISHVDKKPTTSILLFDDNEELYTIYKRDQINVILVKPAKQYKALHDTIYEINIDKEGDYYTLFQNLINKNVSLGNIVHLLNYSNIQDEITETQINQNVRKSIYSILYISKSLMTLKVKNSIKLLYVYSSINNLQPYNGSVSGFAKTIRLENPKYQYQVLHIKNKMQDPHALYEIIQKEFGTEKSNDIEITYEKGERKVKRYDILNLNGTGNTLLKEKGVYIITGGSGGLGLLFAKYLSEKYKAKLLLIGLIPLNDTIEKQMKLINEAGGEAYYYIADVANFNELKNIIDEIKNKFKVINGIIHAAGLIRDSFIMNKDEKIFSQVIDPKMHGTVNLDEITKDDELDFFMMFSSITAVLGNLGQCDYAIGNSFMDEFACYRKMLTEQKKRKGLTVSINWPLWKEGGMQIDETAKKMLKSSTGVDLLETERGLQAFEDALKSNEQQLIVMDGDRNKINMLLGVAEIKNNERDLDQHSMVDNEIIDQVQNNIINIFVELLKVSKEDIDLDIDMNEYGVDSISMVQIIEKIEERYNETLPPSVIIENPTIRLLAHYLIENNIVKSNISGIQNRNTISNNSNTMNKPSNELLIHSPQSSHPVDKIAVIGFCGRFPQSPTIEQFWDNLKNGKDLISEFPQERFDLDMYYSQDKQASNKMYTRWGGILEDCLMFDAGYFRISDNDAMVMDPNQRIILELSQELLDRAGYSKKDINDTVTSVVIGAAESDYQKFYRSRLSYVDMTHFVVNKIQNMMAARISDFFNLKGAAYTVDTACSSSLVALHHACNQLQSGDVDMAIVGGVDCIFGPDIVIGFCKGKALSDERVPHIFDKKANGFVIAEGAGLVLLKPLEKAIQDGDQIHAVISATGINNDGKTMGLTTPNGQAQRLLIEQTLQKAHIDPNTITYLEAHGTGTLIGDAIEIKAATEAYRKYTNEKQYCALGAVKSNMGHCLHASGMASLIKVILSLKHKQIPAILHCDEPSHSFKIHESPFYLNKDLIEWPVREGVRRAGLSSFGFGGTNAHVIIEEFDAKKIAYQPQRKPLPLTQFNRKKYFLGELAVDAAEENVTKNKNKITVKQVRDTRKMEIKTKDTHNPSIIEHYLVSKISSFLNVSESDIDIKENFLDIGFDSLKLVDLTKIIGEEINIELYPTLLFEYKNIQEFSQYLYENHNENLQEYFKRTGQHFEERVIENNEIEEEIQLKEDEPAVEEIEQIYTRVQEPLAIIGINGVFPQSDDISEFWKNLENEKDLITEIPKERLHWGKYLNISANEEYKNITRGGFINDIDKFDTSFFRITAKEAEYMDPQQRIFLQIVWKTIEDAGYSPIDLSGTKCGVFVGVSTFDYAILQCLKDRKIESYTGIGVAHSSLANRISYIFNLHGPSEPIDTACSSSLIALHRAIRAIYSGDCDMAIVGGVNAILTADASIAFQKAGMLSPDGKCRSFSKGANGYVRGEGAGAIIIKPLSKAKDNHDNIYALIKGSAVNHGGHANSFTAPNPKSQAEVIITAYEKAGISPDTITYIEAHGTGTELGDSIEIDGLKKAFKELYANYNIDDQKKQFCGVGSVKTNIGHLEAASGIAGIIKVVLAMKYKKLPANINFEELNPYIKLDGSPFYIVRKTETWERQKDKDNNEIPRRAGISTFGFVGANAHVILEEYDNSIIQEKLPDHDSQIILLSARNEERLMVYLKEMVRFLEKDMGIDQRDENCDNQDLFNKIKHDLSVYTSEILSVTEDTVDLSEQLHDHGFDNIGLSSLINRINEKYSLPIDVSELQVYSTLESLAEYMYELKTGFKLLKTNVQSQLSLHDIAYTLQVGREPMEERLAVIVSDKNELLQILKEYLDKKEQIRNLYRGNSKDDKNKALNYLEGREGEEFIKVLFNDRKYIKLIQLWIAGIEVDWKLLYVKNRPKRVSLPTYPFIKERYWLSDSDEQSAAKVNLEQENVSDTKEHKADIYFSEIKKDMSGIRKAIEKYFLNNEIERGIKKYLQLNIANRLSIPENDISTEIALMDLGVSSIMLVEILKELAMDMNIEQEISPTILFEYYTINKLSKYFYQNYKEEFKLSFFQQ